ncbi:unnamed protein product [Musa textilis]
MWSSSISPATLWALILAVIFLSPASRSSLSQATSDEAFLAYHCDRHHHRFLHRRHHHRLDQYYHDRAVHGLPSWCLRHRLGQLQPPPQPPVRNEIDPRYGVEKRLVPTGPNPLHN